VERVWAVFFVSGIKPKGETMYQTLTTFKVFVPAYMGCGTSQRIGIALTEKGYKKAFVVFDKGTRDAGIITPIIENIENAGIEVCQFDGVLPDPPTAMVEEASAKCNAFKPDVIVAIGGGSTMDTAKSVNVLVNNPPPLRQYLGLAKTIKSGVPLVFVPTTSGTGSETTTVSVLSITEQGGRKDSILSHVCQGSMAFLDPELTVGMPPKMTAATGLDAFAHAAEAITGSMANPISDELGASAIRLIYNYLPKAFDDGKDLEARERMQLGSFLAGAAFEATSTQLSHSFGHSMGTFFHVVHGLGCAVCLPWVIARSAKYEPHKVRIIADAMGLNVPKSAGSDELARAVKEAIIAFNKRVQIPNIKGLGISKEAILAIVPAIIADGPSLTAPWPINNAEVTAMIEEAYEI
jgi:alcohol dehydrogenase